MKIILKEEVSSLGQFGDVVNVANGYARNFLIPKGLAVEASKSNINQFEAEKAAYLKKAEAVKEKAEKLKSDIELLSLSFSRKAGEEEKLFGSVTSMDIEAELKDKGFEIDRKDILLEEPLKSLGVFTVGVRLHPEVTAGLKVWVVKE